VKSLPYWVELLDYSHDHPYFFRFPKGIHNVAIPDADHLPNDLASVIEMVSSATQA
jgi:hypothetical protein